LLTIEEISGGLRPLLEEKEMLRALPLKPTKGSAFGNCKLLKKLEQNFLVSFGGVLANRRGELCSPAR